MPKKNCAGFINEIELKAIIDTDSPHSKEWMPIYWAMALIKQAKMNKKIDSDSQSYVVDLYAVIFVMKEFFKQCHVFLKN